MPGQHIRVVFLVGGKRYPGIITKCITNGHWDAYAWESEQDKLPVATASGDTEQEARQNLIEQLQEENDESTNRP